MKSPFREPPPKTDPATPLWFVIVCCAIALGVIAYMLLKAEGVLP